MKVFIRHWHPTPLNKLLGHWATAHKRKKADRQIVRFYFCNMGFERATTKRALQITIILKKGQRACDPDAYQKSLCDALVHAEMLKDDNRQWVEHLPIKYDRHPEGWGTIIELTDIPEVTLCSQGNALGLPVKYTAKPTSNGINL